MESLFIGCPPDDSGNSIPWSFSKWYLKWPEFLLKVFSHLWLSLKSWHQSFDSFAELITSLKNCSRRPACSGSFRFRFAELEVVSEPTEAGEFMIIPELEDSLCGIEPVEMPEHVGIVISAISLLKPGLTTCLDKMQSTSDKFKLELWDDLSSVLELLDSLSRLKKSERGSLHAKHNRSK